MLSSHSLYGRRAPFVFHSIAFCSHSLWGTGELHLVFTVWCYLLTVFGVQEISIWFSQYCVLFSQSLGYRRAPFGFHSIVICSHSLWGTGELHLIFTVLCSVLTVFGVQESSIWFSQCGVIFSQSLGYRRASFGFHSIVFCSHSLWGTGELHLVFTVLCSVLTVFGVQESSI